MTTQLEQLQKWSTIVVDSGDLTAINQYQPMDVTTNPSLILQAINHPDYQNLIPESLKWASKQPSEKTITKACDWLNVQIGKKILSHIPGIISTEIDPRVSFNMQDTIKRAHDLIELYHQFEVDTSRVLIKIAATWEGIQAAGILEKNNIHCNLTLLFSMEQAKVCAFQGVTFISPFVGRITDWYNQRNQSFITDPGVQSVQNIYNYYKNSGYSTIIMAASFRNVEQILALAGCDKLTISPKFLNQLTINHEVINCKLTNNNTTKLPDTPLKEAEFRWHLNENAMATEKLAEGIRKFTTDIRSLEKILHFKGL